jgi:hypothetical protein
MAELGIVAAQGREGLKKLLAIIADNGDERLPIDACKPDRADGASSATDAEHRFRAADDGLEHGFRPQTP